MIGDEMDNVIPLPRKALVSSAKRAEFEPPVPHATVALEGVLCCGRPLPRRRRDILSIALPPLANLVRQVTDWPDASRTGEDYLGDYRFLVLDFTTSRGIEAFVQIWSEPCCELIVEVGPGNRDDAARQAFADGVRAALQDRGFEIGGSADNFKKLLPCAPHAESPQVARELLAILLDVVGYDGSTDLDYKFHQESHLRPAHVVSGLDRSTLQTHLTAWGLRARPSSEEAHILEVSDLHRQFQLHLFCPYPSPSNDFWEVHCLAVFNLNQKQAAALSAEVNGKPHLMKAFVFSEPAEETQQVRLSHGINLAGGVTLDHVRSQIFEFLELLRKFRREFQ